MHLENFGIIDKRVMTDWEISDTTKAVYALLCCYTDNDTMECFPSQVRLAGELKLGVRTVVRHMAILKKLSIVSRFKRPGQPSTITLMKHGNIRYSGLAGGYVKNS